MSSRALSRTDHIECLQSPITEVSDSFAKNLSASTSRYYTRTSHGSYLIFSMKCRHTRLMRSHCDLASLEHLSTSALHVLACCNKQRIGALDEEDTHEERVELQLVIMAKDILERLGGLSRTREDNAVICRCCRRRIHA